MKKFTNDILKKRIDKRNKIRKIIKYLFYPILILIVICAANILYQMTIKKEKNVSLFGYKPYIVLSGSMEPEFKIGDLVISKKVKEENVKIGDIITFESDNGATITHRVVDIIVKDGEKYYQTKGDNNNSIDIGLILFENINGKYVFKINKVGGIMTLIITPSGIIVLILIMIIIYINITKASDRKIARHVIRKRYKENKV